MADRKLSPSEDAQLRERITKVLWMDACAAILFDVDGTTVSGASFLWAAHYINAKRVGIAIRPPKEGAAAQYEPATNTLVFPGMNFGMDDQGRMDIVHECTHLWVDSTKKKTLAIVSEMCGYIAGATFIEAQGLKHPNSPIRKAAQPVARHVLAGADLNQPPALRSCIALRYAILSSDLYKHLETDRAYDYGEDGV